MIWMKKLLRFGVASAVGLGGGGMAAAAVVKTFGGHDGAGPGIVLLAALVFFPSAIGLTAYMLIREAREARRRGEAEPMTTGGLVAQLVVFAGGLVVLLLIGALWWARSTVTSHRPAPRGAPTELFPVA